MAAKDYRKGAIPYAFVALPKDVLKSQEFVVLPASAKALLIDLATKYMGKNNGQLSVSFEIMKHSGWTSKTKLIRAKRALLECNFALCTRKGHPPNTPEWIGFTWWKLDWEKTMDIGPTGWPYLNFIKTNDLRAARPTREELYARHETILVVPKRDRCPPGTPHGGTEMGPMNDAKEPESVPKQHHSTEVKAAKSIGPETAPVLELLSSP